MQIHPLPKAVFLPAREAPEYAVIQIRFTYDTKESARILLSPVKPRGIEQVRAQMFVPPAT